MIFIFGNAIHRAHFDALWFIVVAHAFSAFLPIDLVYFFAHVNGVIRAFGFTNIAVDAVIVNFKGHGSGVQKVGGETRVETQGSKICQVMQLSGQESVGFGCFGATTRDRIK